MELIEVSLLASTVPSLSSHILESKQIDGVWVILNVTLSSTSILLYYFSIGDHYCFILDFNHKLFFRDDLILIVKYKMRHLTISQSTLVE